MNFFPSALLTLSTSFLTLGFLHLSTLLSLWPEHNGFLRLLSKVARAAVHACLLQFLSLTDLTATPLPSYGFSSQFYFVTRIFSFSTASVIFPNLIPCVQPSPDRSWKNNDQNYLKRECAAPKQTTIGHDHVISLT